MAIIAKYSYVGIFMIMGLGILGFPIPDETFMAFVGFSAYQGRIYYPLALIVAFAGTSCGITIGYILGRRFGYPLLEKNCDRMHISCEKLHKAQEFYKKYGELVLTIGYFVPGVRHVFAILAGISLMSYRSFAMFADTGGLLWTITFVSLGYYLGKHWHRVAVYSVRYMIPVAVIMICAFFVAIYLRGVNRTDTTSNHMRGSGD
jgi:membrane protein DedA with SNARE-associated domain